MERKEDTDNDALVLTQAKRKTKKPSMYNVLLLNDDYTPMEYVVKLLKVVFKKGESEAVSIMLMVHEKGSGVCGVYTREIAETKVSTVLNMAKKDEHPLKCIMEEE